MAAESLQAEYFDHLYADSSDPWQISSGWYEDRKRAVMAAVLPRRHYRLAFEPGCGNGVLTARWPTLRPRRRAGTVRRPRSSQ